MEIRKNAVPVMVDYECPKCKEGYLRPIGTMFTTNPPIISHLCNNPSCEYSECFRDKSYPYLDYDVDDDCGELEKIYEIHAKTREVFKPLEDIWRAENRPEKYTIPDATQFNKWIVENFRKP